jgi:phosphatidylinositol phospholipase C delta
LAENRFDKLAQTDPVSLVQQTTWRLLRLYPGGLRQDSSNPNPVHGWNFGLQMVALNYQNEDDMMALCYGKFLDNGGCGYILKPDYLTSFEQTRFNPWNTEVLFDYPQTLTITIISGQFLPRSHVKSSDIPDPFVRVSTHGLRCDERMEKTKVVENNGFDPVWNETFQFSIKFPQMCLLYFSVLDYDLLTNDDRLAYFCSPVTIIQPGNRSPVD